MQRIKEIASLVADRDHAENSTSVSLRRVLTDNLVNSYQLQWETTLPVLPRNIRQLWFWQSDEGDEETVGYQLLNTIFQNVSF